MKLARRPASVLLQPQSTPGGARPSTRRPSTRRRSTRRPSTSSPSTSCRSTRRRSTSSASPPSLATCPRSGASRSPRSRCSARAAGRQRSTDTPLATLPLQNVTLRDYYALTTEQNPETRTANPIDPITLADLDLTPQHSRQPARERARALRTWTSHGCATLDVWCRLFGTRTARPARSRTRPSCRRRCRARP